MNLLTELRLLFRARVFLILLLAELYLIVLALMLQEFSEEAYLRSLFLYANIVPWAVAGLVLVIEMVTRDIQCGTFWILSRLADPLRLYLQRLALVYCFTICAALLSDLLLSWSIIPFSVPAMALRLAAPLVLFLSAGFLAAVRFKSETPALVAASALLIPLFVFVSRGGLAERAIERALSVTAMLLASGAMLWLARLQLRMVAQPGGNRRRTMIRRFLMLGIPVVVLFSGCSRRQQDSSQYEPLPIEVWGVEAGATGRTLELDATAQPNHDIEIHAPVRGVVRWHHMAAPGSPPCMKGAVIAEIRSDARAAKLDAARKELVLSQQKLDQQKQALSMGLISPNDLRPYELSVLHLSTDLRVLETQESEASIRAPFEGTVTWRADVPEGHDVQENTPLFRLAATGQWKATGYCSRDEYEQLESARSWFVLVGEAPAAIAGSLDEASPDPALPGRLRLVVTFSPPAGLAPGTAAKIRATRATNTPGITIPSDCVVYVNRLPHVFAVVVRSKLSRSGSIKLQPITLGQKTGDYVAVLSGIAPGDLIARSSLDSLGPNMMVAVSH